MTNAVSVAQYGSSNPTMRNRIINGSMIIDQRNAGASVTPTNGQYTLDRWVFSVSQASKLTTQQSSTVPANFINSMLVTSSSAYSVGSGDYFNVQTKIEGFNCSDLGWGTSNAKTVTLSFQVYSSLTGTFGGAIQNNAGNRSYPFSYTISSANTWTTVSVTIPGDTTGTWLTNNSVGMVVYFSLGTGTTYSGAAGTWAGSDYRSATGASSVVGTNGATWYFTGVQLEAGSTATPFEYRQYGTELALCQRYAWVIKGIGAGNQMVAGPNFPRLGTYQYLAYGSGTSTPVPMRIAPSLTASGNFQWITYGSTPGDGYTTGLVASGGVNLTAASNTYVAYRIGNTGNSNFGSAMVIFLLDYDGTAVLINSAEL